MRKKYIIRNMWSESYVKYGKFQDFANPI